MLIKSNAEQEKQKIDELCQKDPYLQRQRELFEEEMRFKQMLIDARRSKKMTQKEISDQSGLSQQAVSRLEKGNGGTLETVIRYLNAMGIKLSLKEEF